MHGGFRHPHRIDGETYGPIAGGTDSIVSGGWNGTPSDTQTLRGPYVSPVEFLVPSHDWHFIEDPPSEAIGSCNDAIASVPSIWNGNRRTLRRTMGI